MLPLVVTLLIFACSQRSHATGFDTGECGRTKGCFLPEDLECYNGCSGMRFSWILIDEGLMKFEITVDANSSNGIYVAVGFSHDDMMGDDSVIECSSLQGEALSLKLSYNINGTTDNSTDGEPTNRRLSNNDSEYFSQSLTSFTNGTVYCAGVLNITGAVEAGLLDFDPTNYYYLLMASGPTDKKGLLRHIHSVATPTALQLINIVPDFDTDPCGISKGCYLATNEDSTLNGVAVSYRMLNSSFVAFELTAPADSKNDVFVAVSFSTSKQLANTSSIECSSLGNESMSMKFSYNNEYENNVRIAGEKAVRATYFTQEIAVFQSGKIHCSAIVNVQGSLVSDEIFTYTPRPYYLILTTGNAVANGLLPPNSTSTSLLPKDLSKNEIDFSASTCGVMKSCVLPDQCYGGCNGMGFSYKLLSNSLMKIELFSVLDGKNQYVAVGFSNDDKMGNESVIECSAMGNERYSLKFSYNNATPSNVRIPGEEKIRASYFTQTNTISADGELYCTAVVDISGWSLNKEVFTYDSSQPYYILLASGSTNDQGLNVHSHAVVSSSRFLGVDDTPGSFDNSSCGSTKGCFTANTGNGMTVSYQVISPESIRFELTMKTIATASVYLAVGFSSDNKMGQESVIECSALTGQSLSMKFSYNPTTKNVRIPGEENIRGQYFTNAKAAISDGVMYCSALVNVSGWPSSIGQVFKYDPEEKYFLLLAAGSAISSGLTQHSITAVSSPRLLSDYQANGSDGISATTKMRLIRAHAILMFLSWFFCVPTAVMFARFLRTSWPTLKPGGLLIWFHVHRSANTLAIALSISSFICILAANNWDWTGPGSQSSKWGKTHSMVGIFALCLCWIQPFVSAIRCNPGHPRRPFFNWAHRCIGVIAMILATTTVCIAADHFVGIWPHRVAQIILSLMPITLLIILSILFLFLGKFIDVNELNFQKIHRIRQLIVYVGVTAMAGITITLSVFVGIGA